MNQKLSYEFIIQTAKLIKKRGLFNVMVSNTAISKEAPRASPLYRRLEHRPQRIFRVLPLQISAPPLAVLNTITAAASVSHVEVTTLIIPGKNDSKKTKWTMTRWLTETVRIFPSI